jgi:hypothetical protein
VRLLVWVGRAQRGSGDQIERSARLWVATIGRGSRSDATTRARSYRSPTASPPWWTRAPRALPGLRDYVVPTYARLRAPPDQREIVDGRLQRPCFSNQYTMLLPATTMLPLTTALAAVTTPVAASRAPRP